MKIPSYAILLAVIASVTITGVYATHNADIGGDQVITQSTTPTEDGHLTIQDGRIFVPNGRIEVGGGTVNDIPLIRATGVGLTTFQVSATDGSAIFTMRSKGTTGQAGIQFNDDDTSGSGAGASYRIRIPGSGDRLEVVDQGAMPQQTRLILQGGTGNFGIGSAGPQEKLDVDGNIRLTGNIVSPNDICIGNCP